MQRLKKEKTQKPEKLQATERKMGLNNRQIVAR